MSDENAPPRGRRGAQRLDRSLLDEEDVGIRLPLRSGSIAPARLFHVLWDQDSGRDIGDIISRVETVSALAAIERAVDLYTANHPDAPYSDRVKLELIAEFLTERRRELQDRAQPRRAALAASSVRKRRPRKAGGKAKRKKNVLKSKPKGASLRPPKTRTVRK